MAWYEGWGFWYESPDGDVNHATRTSSTNPMFGVITPLAPTATSPTSTGVNPTTSPYIQPPANVPQANSFVPSPAYTEEQRSAKAQLLETLGLYGLSSLADFAWNEYINDIPTEQIMLDIRQTPEYKQRFPAMAELASKGQAISEGQYINYETSAKSLFQAAGLPPGFYDQPSDFTNFLLKGVALPELQSRIDVAKTAVYDSDPATLAALQSYYGINAGYGHIGDATAYFLDPDRALPAIQHQMLAAQDAGAAADAGYHGLLQGQAERMSVLGISQEQAKQGFGTLANLEPLFTNLPGEAGSAPTQNEGIQAVFENNATAANKLSSEQSKRKAAFQSGGSFTQTSGGVTGL